MKFVEEYIFPQNIYSEVQKSETSHNLKPIITVNQAVSVNHNYSKTQQDKWVIK